MPGLLKATTAKPADQFFGRKRELRVISEALWGAEKTSLVIIQGPAGIGKTSLINYALKQNQDKRCFKLYGKFQNHRENSPYAAFRQAFAFWSQQILILPDEEFDYLKENTTSALQTNISAVTSVFPDLEVFFSRKHLTQFSYKADSHQIKNRFYYFLKKFLKSITRLGYQLVIFLDDLQWADKASLQLLEELTNSDIEGLTFVAAYRPQEDSSRVFSEKIASLLNMEKVRVVTLKPLSRSLIARMIPSEWNFSKQNIIAFTNYLWLESEGNPFKIKEILKIIQAEGLVTLRPDNPLFWERLPKAAGGEDSVNFVREQILSLPFPQIKIIATAASLGYYFTLELLKDVLGRFDEEVKESIEQLTTRGFLLKKKSNFVFAHDNIISAANSLLSNVEKSDLHKRAGNYFLKISGNYEQAEFFRAVNHFNKAKELGGSRRVNSNEIILLNLQAARLAIQNSAFETAHNYVEVADKLFQFDCRAIRIKDPLLRNIFKAQKLEVERIRFLILFGYAETMFLLQRFEVALCYAQQVLDLNCNRHQKVQAMLIKIRICSALIYQKNTSHILMDGLSSFEQILGEFNIFFPTSTEDLDEESRKYCLLLQKKAAAYNENTDFVHLLNPDREYQDLLKLITTSLTFLYYVDVKKHLFLNLKALLMVFQKGHTPVSPVLFSASFVISSISRENRDLAYFLGTLSLKMIEKRPFERYSHIIYYVATLNFYTWSNHYKICVQKLKESVLKAYEAGDPHYAGFCSTNIRLLNCYRGKNLVKHLESAEKLEKNQHVFFISSSDSDLANYLTGIKPGLEEGNFQFSEDLIKQSRENLNSRYHLNLALQKLNYISGNYEAARQAGEVCENLPNVYKGFQIELEHHFFYSLSLLQLAYKDSSCLTQVLQKVLPKLEEFRRLASFGSGNYLHKIFLLEAEIAKCKGSFEEATLLYEKAIAQAQKEKFIHHAAIAAELLFEYYQSKERFYLARQYLKICLRCYKRWGAMAKVAQLRIKYAALVKDKKRRDKKALPAGHYETIKKIIRRNVPSGSIHLAELGGYLLDLLTKDFKAERGGTLILKDNEWQIIAEKSLNVQVHQPLQELRDILPVSILNYSIKKGEKMVLQDAFGEPLFAEDECLKKQRPLNISVFPVKQSGETIGVFYLENCRINSEAEKDLFLVKMELACTTFANAVYYENINLLNKQIKVQERNRIEAVIESQEKERQRIAGELHDSLGQILALTKINLSRLNPGDPASINEPLINNLAGLIDESCEELRSISHNLMPPDLSERSITEILENLIHKNRMNGVVYRFHVDGLKNDLSVACKFTLYRVLQEIIQNIIKHAQATRVNVSLSQSEELINLFVEDNGKGFDTSVTSLGLGLKNIYSRVKLLDGYLDIDSSINSGTVFNVSIPIKN